jgi:uncharacterized membrane protein YsdA (DUF1294 family)
MKPLLILFLIANLVSFVMMWIDKARSVANAKEGSPFFHRRMSERSLHLLSFVGGFLGVLIGMKVLRHKSKKRTFKMIELLIWIVWLSAGLYFGLIEQRFI